MPSILRVDQLQTTTGTPLLSSDANGLLSVSTRFKLPNFTTANLPSSASTGEVVFDTTEFVAKFWDGTKWQTLGSKKLTSAIVGMHWIHWTSTFQSTTAQTYEKVPGSEFTFQTKQANSSFVMMADIPGYQAGTSSGVNMAYQFNGTMYAGTNGGSGDTWMGNVHSGVAAAGFNLKKIWVVQPNLAAGSTVTAACMVGHWQGTSSSHYFNYPGYSPEAEFVILEFLNPTS
jgi:hypothetical protein